MSAGTNTPSSTVQTPGHKTSPPGLGGSTEKTTPSSGQAEDYEENLQQLAAIKLNDDAFQAELSKTDQWFVNLSETAKTATFYQLLQHIDSPPQLQFIHMLVRDRITSKSHLTFVAVNVVLTFVQVANRPTAIITMPPTPSPIEAEQTKPNNLTFNRRSSQPALHSTQEMWPNQLAATDIPINTAGPPRRKSFDFLGEHESFESTNTPFLYLSDSDSGASIVGQRHVAPGSQRVAPSVSLPVANTTDMIAQNWAFSRRVSIISDKAEIPKHETKPLENLGSLWPAAPLIQRPHGDKGMLRMPKAVGFTGTNRPSSGPANASMPSFYERRSKSISGQGSFGASGSLNTRRTSLPTSPSRRPESRQGNGLDSIDLSIMAGKQHFCSVVSNIS